MTSTRPYLIRAFYDWIVDNACTPHIVVNATIPKVDVPLDYVDGGQIVLNISLSAVQGLTLGNQAIDFKARFGGMIRNVHAPISSIMAIYAKENGRGMVFTEEDADLPLPPSDSTPGEGEGKQQKGGKGGKGGKTAGKPHLKIVK